MENSENPPPPATADAGSATGRSGATDRISIRAATDADREVIYRMRHDVYARELGQHPVNEQRRLTDALDEFNIYIVAREGDAILGFISLTPPTGSSYSLDKYFDRADLPFPVDEGLYEIRILTVPKSRRSRLLAFALMFAAFRWIEAAGGFHAAGIGRKDILKMYRQVGLHPQGLQVTSGSVDFELIHGSLATMQAAAVRLTHMEDRIEREFSWDLDFPLRATAPCYHGGRFFEAVGAGFDTLDRLDQVISADVLDAWFPPSPKVLEALSDRLPRILSTSPPTGCEGLISTIARTRGIPENNIIPGSGSSTLIFLALRQWLTPESRALILDPTYSEYSHALEKVVKCRVDRLRLSREDNFALTREQLTEAATTAEPYDLVVIVNPNSPTGRHLRQEELIEAIRAAPPSTCFWIDETYIEYVGAGQSLESFACAEPNVVVCKSMSKTYALSGARVAYLCGHSRRIEDLRAITPPWAVGLPAQIAAVKALEDPAYYRTRHRETHELREKLAESLTRLGWEVVPGCANFLLCFLPESGPDAIRLIKRCRERDLFLRDAEPMGSQLGERAVRIAVKDAATNERMIAILREESSGSS